MRALSVFSVVAAFVGLVSVGVSPVDVMADGTETLGPPSIAIESGSGIVAAGTGLVTQPAAINLDVPLGATVNQVLLYWDGTSKQPNPADNTIVVEGNEIEGTLIGGYEWLHYLGATFRSDITDLGLVTPGSNTLTLEGVNFEGGVCFGAGVLVIFDYGSDVADIELRDGNDTAFEDATPPLDTTVPQTFTFAPGELDRTATLAMFFSSVKGSVSGGDFRPTSMKISVGGSTTFHDNMLSSLDGEEWDTLNIAVPIPAGVTSLTVQALSVDRLGLGLLPASFGWIISGLSLPAEPVPEPTVIEYTGDAEGCEGEQVALSARLTSKGDTPISGKVINFQVSDQSCEGITNESGVATCSLLLSQEPGNYMVTASFIGDNEYESSLVSQPFEITICLAPSIVITACYTTDEFGNPAVQFNIGDTVQYHYEYDVVGGDPDPEYLYVAKGIVKPDFQGCRKRRKYRTKEYVFPGLYSGLHMVIEKSIPKCPRIHKWLDVDFILKLKEEGYVRDTATCNQSIIITPTPSMGGGASSCP